MVSSRRRSVFHSKCGVCGRSLVTQRPIARQRHVLTMTTVDRLPGRLISGSRGIVSLWSGLPLEHLFLACAVRTGIYLAVSSKHPNVLGGHMCAAITTVWTHTTSSRLAVSLLCRPISMGGGCAAASMGLLLPATFVLMVVTFVLWSDRTDYATCRSTHSGSLRQT